MPLPSLISSPDPPPGGLHGCPGSSPGDPWCGRCPRSPHLVDLLPGHLPHLPHHRSRPSKSFDPCPRSLHQVWDPPQHNPSPGCRHRPVRHLLPEPSEPMHDHRLTCWLAVRSEPQRRESLRIKKSIELTHPHDTGTPREERGEIRTMVRLETQRACQAPSEGGRGGSGDEPNRHLGSHGGEIDPKFLLQGNHSLIDQPLGLLQGDT
jgi:hypothetical protein